MLLIFRFVFLEVKMRTLFDSRKHLAACAGTLSSLEILFNERKSGNQVVYLQKEPSVHLLFICKVNIGPMTSSGK